MVKKIVVLLHIILLSEANIVFSSESEICNKLIAMNQENTLNKENILLLSVQQGNSIKHCISLLKEKKNYFKRKIEDGSKPNNLEKIAGGLLVPGLVIFAIGQPLEIWNDYSWKSFNAGTRTNPPLLSREVFVGMYQFQVACALLSITLGLYNYCYYKYPTIKHAKHKIKNIEGAISKLKDLRSQVAPFKLDDLSLEKKS